MITHGKFELDVGRGPQAVHLKTVVDDECFEFASAGQARKLTGWFRTSTALVSPLLYKFHIYTTGQAVEGIHTLKFLKTIIGPVYIFHVYRELFEWEIGNHGSRKFTHSLDTRDDARAN